MNISNEQNATKMLKRAQRRHMIWYIFHTYGALFFAIVSISILAWIAVLSIVTYLLIGKWWW